MDERQAALCRYRLEKAENCLKSAHILTVAEDYYGAANRSYYAIFHSVRAILALDGVDFSKHSGVMAYFQRQYVKTEIFPKEYSKILREAFDVRSDADYDDYYVLSKDKVQKQIDQAQFFLAGMKEYVEKKLDEKESKDRG